MLFTNVPQDRALFEQITSADCLFTAWEIFQRGKRSRFDVQRFWRRLENNIFMLRRELLSGAYRHGAYESFLINDPKPRHIRKAQVRDRIVHQAIHTQLYQMWEPALIHDVYSARIGKGTHYGVNRLSSMLRKVSRNFTAPCWALKCDIRKLYDSMDHSILMGLIRRRVYDHRALRLIHEVIDSFHTEDRPGKGVPIGNVTSQIFTNIYLSELDRFVKQELRVRCYGRFSDDFVLLAPRRSDLLGWRNAISDFLESRLQLTLHPHKVSIRPAHQGVDFLGYVVLPHHRVLRTSTRKRMIRRLGQKASEFAEGESSRDVLRQSVASYLGMLSHADSFALQRTVLNSFG